MAQPPLAQTAFTESPADHGLVVDPQLGWIGTTLGRDDGERGVRELFDQRKLPVEAVDAIVCVNDDVTLGALEALTRRGVVVPEQIALVGSAGWCRGPETSLHSSWSPTWVTACECPASEPSTPSGSTRHSIVVQPLEHARAPVGLAAFSWGAHNPILYEQLREVLGGAVHALGEG